MYFCSCKQWVVRCRREDLLKRDAAYLNRNCFLCASHFEPSQFTNPAMRNRLIWNALPSVFDIRNPPSRLQSLRRQTIRVPRVHNRQSSRRAVTLVSWQDHNYSSLKDASGKLSKQNLPVHVPLSSKLMQQKVTLKLNASM